MEPLSLWYNQGMASESSKDSTHSLLRNPHYWAFGLAIAVLPPLVTSLFTYQASKEDSVATYKSTQKAVATLQEEQAQLLKSIYKLEAEVEMLRQACAPSFSGPSARIRLKSESLELEQQKALKGPQITFNQPEALMPPSLEAAKRWMRQASVPPTEAASSAE